MTGCKTKDRTLQKLQISAANGGLNAAELQLAFERARHMRALAYKDIFSRLFSTRAGNDASPNMCRERAIRAPSA